MFGILEESASEPYLVFQVVQDEQFRKVKEILLKPSIGARPSFREGLDPEGVGERVEGEEG